MIIGILFVVMIVILLAAIHSNDANHRADLIKQDGARWFKIDKDHNKTFIEKVDTFNSIDRK
jgi:hypothetical protein